MAEENRKKPARHRPGLGVRGIIVLLCFSVLLLLVVPAAALIPPGGAGVAKDPVVSSGSASIRDLGAGASRMTAASNTPFNVHPGPTPLPARLNRTSLLQLAARAVAERPRVAFILIVALALIGLGAVLFLLFRSRLRPSWGRGKSAKGPPGHATVIEAPPAAKPAGGTTAGYPEPAVPFPPSLEKRFLNPVFIGEGGLARIFRAENAKTHQTVAVKIPVRFDEVTGTHFTRDIVFWQGLEHKNIIRIYSSNILPVPYIEMEYAPSSLAALPLPLPEERAVGMVLEIAHGLAYAHGRGIVHRDIKPENILLAADGTPKITDWGLGRAIGNTRQSSIIGYSPAYAAPEQIAPRRYGRPGPATDIYQLGMLLYEMLTGSVAFDNRGMHDLNLAILDDPPVLPSWQGTHEKELGKIIMKCLAKRPEERYSSVADLVRDLEAIRFPA
ncbi:MAG: serine/threonine-protein kinase [Methanoregula sp.]|jgi:hypothetical protein|uniref:serine/threonine-protein kinase n=1 Tax=Methanoregula sp. TaxID=2052170 RepID=UPI003D13FBE8